MIKGFAHVCLSATDLAAVERFYCGGLGLKKAFDFIRNDRVIGFYLELSQGESVGRVKTRRSSSRYAITPVSLDC
jgi:catechol 2,3-dioxygenase-like lactoylglutathione lyase family enzyme